MYRIPAGFAAAAAFHPDESAPHEPADGIAASVPGKAPAPRVRPTYGDIARDLADVPAIQLAIRRRFSRARPTLGNEFVAPRLPMEEKLADIWAEVLGLDRVGVRDNFFDLGGDSIGSIQVVARTNEAGLALTLRQHFQFPVIARQASFLTAAAAAEPAVPSAPFSLARLGRKGLDDVMDLLAKTQR
jgi:aryl carrier-like protein